MLALETVTKRFGGLTAVDGVTATFAAGSINAIIGPNGAGKTTLFAMIAGATVPTSGRIMFEGRDITGQRADAVCRAGIGRTFQVVRPFWNLTVRDHVRAAATFGSAGMKGGSAGDLPAKAGSYDPREGPSRGFRLKPEDRGTNQTPVGPNPYVGPNFSSGRNETPVGPNFGSGGTSSVGPNFSSGVEDVLKLTGLDRRAEEPARNLTLADCRRLEIARALATGARLILLDETMAGLTTEETRDAIELVKRVRDIGRTVILIEHVLPAVTGLAERAIVLDRGAVIADGAPRDVLASAAVKKAYLGDS